MGTARGGAGCGDGAGVTRRKTQVATAVITARQYLRDRLASVRPQPACTVCGQTYTDPGPWGPESLYEIQVDADLPAEAMVFEACSECATIGVCPDCIHEQECCAEAQETAEGTLWS